jgi:hypothetical protein
MKILSLYNEPVKLEVGDLIAKDDGQLWIMDGCDVYKATQPLDKLDLTSRIYVHSAGNYAKHKENFSELEWIRYQP